MNRSLTAALLALAALLNLAGAPAFGQQPNGQPVQPQPRLDVGKGKIEIPTKNIIAGFTAPAGVPGNLPRAALDNPSVQPGRVKWHTSFEAARQAAQKSGKPVLLFQMLGQLDQQFC